MPLLCEDDVENCMRTAACLVHVGGCHSPEDRRYDEQNAEVQRYYIVVLKLDYFTVSMFYFAHLALLPESIRSWMSL